MEYFLWFYSEAAWRFVLTLSLVCGAVFGLLVANYIHGYSVNPSSRFWRPLTFARRSKGVLHVLLWTAITLTVIAVVMVLCLFIYGLIWLLSPFLCIAFLIALLLIPVTERLGV